jgi:polyhydroxyalkanoate synthase subunit PhaC
VHPRRRHRILTWTDATATLTPDEWLKKAPLHEGSWWPAWQSWLADHSAARQKAARMTATRGSDGAALADAPGTYVRG